MNSINHTLNGLASSLLLNIGLANVALKLDPLSSKEIAKAQDAVNVEGTNFPCNFTPKQGE